MKLCRKKLHDLDVFRNSKGQCRPCRNTYEMHRRRFVRRTGRPFRIKEWKGDPPKMCKRGKHALEGDNVQRWWRSDRQSFDSHCRACRRRSNRLQARRVRQAERRRREAATRDILKRLGKTPAKKLEPLTGQQYEWAVWDAM